MAGVSKRFKDQYAVRAIDLIVEEGMFFSILGPSGCGKTTTLRMLGGFVTPDEGEIRLGGQPVNEMPPHRRDVNTVFQSYALFGHLSVTDNVAFGLKRKRVPAAEIRDRVTRMLRVVSLEERAHAKPAELSGGQQQRVALARALVNMPKLLLLDEPLGALDLKLRRQMQTELKHIQREVGVAFIYVTHDQEEALTMSDRIAVMSDGRVLQVGTPAEIYEHPASLFVAQFIGSINTLPGTYRDGAISLECGAVVPLANSSSARPAAGDDIVACVRPENMMLISSEHAGGPAITGTVAEATYLGSSVSYRIRLSQGGTVEVLAARGSGQMPSVPVGTQVGLRWLPEDCLLFHRSTGESIGTGAAAATAAGTQTTSTTIA